MTIFRAFLACAAIGLSAASVAVAQQQPATPTVGVITAEKQPVSEAERFVGRVEAVERVDIRARVTGYLDAVLFKDGERVKKGAPLYRIERPPFEAALSQAQAATMRAQAQLANATVQRERAEELGKDQRDIRRCSRRSRHRRKIRAGRSGRGRGGAEIRRDQPCLYRHHIADRRQDRTNRRDPRQCCRSRFRRAGDHRQLDPMYVTFPVSQREFMRLGGDSASQRTAGRLQGHRSVLERNDLSASTAQSTSST